MEYLQRNNLDDTEQYALTEEALERGKYYYRNSDDVYRENMMVKNFIREFEKLSNENIMGIYRSAHTGLESMNYTNAMGKIMRHHISENKTYLECLRGILIGNIGVSKMHMRMLRIDP